MILKSFTDMELGTAFYNSMTYTLCLKVSPSRYFDLTLKHMITMRKDLSDVKHIILKRLTYEI